MVIYSIWPSTLENRGHANMLLNYWNINVKFQEVLQINILGQRGSADMKCLAIPVTEKSESRTKMTTSKFTSINIILLIISVGYD